MQLTPEQIAFFNREGWLFLPELFSPEETAFLAREAEAIYAADRPEVWREKSGAPRTAFAAHLYNDAFHVLAAHPRMIAPIEQIFGEKVYMHQFKINAKSAFTGDVWQWHQDYGTWKRDDGMPERRTISPPRRIRCGPSTRRPSHVSSPRAASSRRPASPVAC